MFEKASRMKTRFQTSRGVLSTEDLWDVSLDQLNTLAKALRKELKDAEEEDFLVIKKDTNSQIQLMFDIVLHILNIKKDEKTAREEASVKRAEKERLLELLAKKKDQSLEALSEEEIRAKIESL